MIKAYLRARRGAILAACVTAAMVLAACIAAGQPLSPVVYGLFLSAFVLALAGAVGFFRFRARLLAPVSYTHLDVYKRQGLMREDVIEGIDPVAREHVKVGGPVFL